MFSHRNHDHYEEKDDSCKPCGWINSQGCDAETLVELTREMCEILSDEAINIQDSRCFYRLCIDMANDFQRQHADRDWDQTDFLSSISSYATRVKERLLAFPNWINVEYKWMFGTESVSDLLAKQ